jgi:arylsulfatase A-like enzyme
MFTGNWATVRTGDWERPMDRALPTLAEHFRDRGYHTGAFVANMHFTGWDSGLERGFARYEDYVVNWRQLILSSSYTQTILFGQIVGSGSLLEKLRAVLRPNLWINPKHAFVPKTAETVTNGLLDWHAASSDRPFFAFLNYFDAHAPYHAPPAFRQFSGENGLAEYRGAIAFLDAEIDRLLVTLRQRGVLDRTLIVVTSDHGELFAFKGMSGHAHNLYLNTIRVPLLIRFPERVPAGLRVSQPVTLRDLAATIASLAAPGTPPMPGTSLEIAWAGGTTSPVLSEVRRAPNIESHYPTSRGDLQTLLDERWQLIQNSDGQLELYDYRADSLLERDLARVDSVAPVLSAMRQRLRDLLRSSR